MVDKNFAFSERERKFLQEYERKIPYKDEYEREF